jgi:argininosuccinate lyase
LAVIVDTEDDLQPLVTTAFHDATRATRLLGATLERADFDRERMARNAHANWLTVTELADVLVRREGWSFQQAHALAAAVAREAQPAERTDAARLVRRKAAEAGLTLSVGDEILAESLDPFHFVEVRTTLGGPAPAAVKAALLDASSRLAAANADLEQRRRALAAATETLAAALNAL